MSDAEFAKVEADSDTLMYGSRCALVCGFDAMRREAFAALLEFLGLTDLPVRHCGPADLDFTLKDLTGGVSSPSGDASPLPAAIILSGVRESELHLIIDHWRGLKMPPQFWAALTPTSENWTLGSLLRELELEAQAMRARSEARRRQQADAAEP